MSNYDHEDSLTTLNTALNKSMILMNSPVDNTSKPKGGKVIKINTKIQSQNTSSEMSEIRRKSILKKSKTTEIPEDLDSLSITENDSDAITETRESLHNHIPRPHNLKDFLKKDTVILGPTNSTFNLEDLSDSEEMWVMDIPKTVNPRKLSGQSLLLGEKSKIMVGEERYCAISRSNGCCLTWVFRTGQNNKPYKAVNITPAGSITVRRKLPGMSMQTTDFLDASGVPFPSNLKIRHPFFGPNYNRTRTSPRTKVSKK